MIWAVLDTNVIVSGFGWPQTTPARIIDHLLAGRFVIVMSRPLLDELGRVLSYPKLQPIFKDPLGITLLMESVAVLVDPKSRISVLEDEDDNRILEAASEAHANYIVTGDKAVQQLKIFDESEIVTPKAFLAILEGRQ